MRFGVQLSNYLTNWDDIRGCVEALDGGRWNSVWFSDHFVPPGRGRPETGDAFEGWTVAAAVAGITRKLRIGHLVLGNTYRNPALLAKMAATLDHISQGRITLGLGAAWFAREHQAYGWEFPTMRERQDRFQEAMGLIRALFTADGPVTYEGAYYRLGNAPFAPRCYQQPHLPILVGGTGERRTLRTLAMYGDLMNLDGWTGAGMSLELYRHKVSVLERHCADVGRDPSEIKRTVTMPLLVTDDTAVAQRFIDLLGPGSMAGPRSYLVDRIGEFVEAGVYEIMFGLHTLTNRNDPETVQQVEEQIVAAFD